MSAVGPIPGGAGATMALAEFLAGARDVPGEAREAARTVILDTVGCAVGAVEKPEALMAGQVAHSLGGTPESSLIGRGERTSSHLAAFHNGLLAHVLEMDDTHRASITHVACAVVPAALAVAEARGCAGAELERAVVLGFEASVRVALAIQPSHWERGFHTAGTANVFGAAAAAGALMGLDPDRMASALGLAGTQSGGLLACIFAEGDMSKPLNAAHAAGAGTMAALLAERGFTGPHTALEGRGGFLRAYADQVDPAPLTDRLGERYTILETSLKPYACCRYYHGPIDGLNLLRPRLPTDPDGIREMRVRIFDRATTRPHRTAPASPLDAQMSIPYSLAVAFLEGTVRMQHYAPEQLDNPARRRLAERIRVLADPELSAAFPGVWGAILEVDLASGESLSARVDIPKGEPENPMSPAEVLDKFHSLADPVLGTAGATRLAGVLQDLSGLADCRSLGPALRR